MVVVWSNSAKAELRKAFEFIAMDSSQNAQMVRDTLIDLTIDLPEHYKYSSAIDYYAEQKGLLPVEMLY